jgi:hypothetical protein
MGYSPKHAKPFSARKDIVLSSRRGLFGTSEAGSGRHSASAGHEQRESALADFQAGESSGFRQ